MTGAAPSTPTADVVIRLRPEQVGQHPDNIRDPARDLPALAASIREVGVLVPLIVVPVAAVDGRWTDAVTHVAVDGNRRQAAAAPRRRRAALPGPGQRRRRPRNSHHHGRDRPGPGQPDRCRTGPRRANHARSGPVPGRDRPSNRHENQAAAALTGDAAQQAAGHDLTLDQLAILTDWQTDQAAVALLLGAAHRGPGTFEHAVARLRQDRHAEERKQTLVQDLAEGGIPITEHRPTSHGAPTRLDALADTHGRILTEDGHTQCPGRAAHLTTSYAGDTDAVHCCLDPTANGHVALYEPIPGTGGTGQSGPMTDEQKAERRDLIRRNKEMLAAQEVRLDFLTRTVTGKRHAKAITGWALARVIDRDRRYTRWVGSYGEPTMLGRILGAEHPDQHCRDAAPTRHGVLLWAHVTAALEAEFTKDAWRHTDPDRAAYLTHLVSLGYTPPATPNN